MEKIVMIDDGMSFAYTGISRYQITDSSQAAEGHRGDVSRSHGTTCYQIIRKYAAAVETQWDWYSVQALDPATREGKAEHLLSALAFAADIGARVIHLSIGTRNYADFPPLARQVKKLYEQGVILVAALNNQNTITYPACLPYVYGVARDHTLRDGQYRAVRQNSRQVNFFASGTHLLREGKKVQITPVSNSFAAPVITAKALKLLTEQPNLDFAGLYESLTKQAPGQREIHTTSPDFFAGIGKAVCFQLTAAKPAAKKAARTDPAAGRRTAAEKMAPGQMAHCRDNLTGCDQAAKDNLAGQALPLVEDDLIQQLPFPCRTEEIMITHPAQWLPQLKEILAIEKPDLLLIAADESEQQVISSFYPMLRTCYHGKIAALTPASGRLAAIGEGDQKLWISPTDPWRDERAAAHTAADVPLLLFAGRPPEPAGYQLVRGLIERFRADGYFAAWLADEPLALLTGGSVFDGDRPLAGQCEAHVHFYQSDLVLVTLAKESGVMELLPAADICLTVKALVPLIRTRLRTDQAVVEIINQEEEELYTQLIALLT